MKRHYEGLIEQFMESFAAQSQEQERVIEGLRAALTTHWDDLALEERAFLQSLNPGAAESAEEVKDEVS